MPTLDIKNFPADLYRKLKDRAGQHRSVSQEGTHILEGALAKREPRSILELEGLGKDLWKEIDAADHVERERDTWS